MGKCSSKEKKGRKPVSGNASKTKDMEKSRSMPITMASRQEKTDPLPASKRKTENTLSLPAGVYVQTEDAPEIINSQSLEEAHLLFDEEVQASTSSSMTVGLRKRKVESKQGAVPSNIISSDVGLESFHDAQDDLPDFPVLDQEGEGDSLDESNFQTPIGRLSYDSSDSSEKFFSLPGRGGSATTIIDYSLAKPNTLTLSSTQKEDTFEEPSKVSASQPKVLQEKPDDKQHSVGKELTKLHESQPFVATENWELVKQEAAIPADKIAAGKLIDKDASKLQTSVFHKEEPKTQSQALASQVSSAESWKHHISQNRVQEDVSEAPAAVSPSESFEHIEASESYFSEDDMHSRKSDSSYVLLGSENPTQQSAPIEIPRLPGTCKIDMLEESSHSEENSSKPQLLGTQTQEQIDFEHISMQTSNEQGNQDRESCHLIDHASIQNKDKHWESENHPKRSLISAKEKGEMERESPTGKETREMKNVDQRISTKALHDEAKAAEKVSKVASIISRYETLSYSVNTPTTETLIKSTDSGEGGDKSELVPFQNLDENLSNKDEISVTQPRGMQKESALDYVDSHQPSRAETVCVRNETITEQNLPQEHLSILDEASESYFVQKYATEIVEAQKEEPRKPFEEVQRVAANSDVAENKYINEVTTESTDILVLEKEEADDKGSMHTIEEMKECCDMEFPQPNYATEGKEERHLNTAYLGMEPLTDVETAERESTRPVESQDAVYTNSGLEPEYIGKISEKETNILSANFEQQRLPPKAVLNRSNEETAKAEDKVQTLSGNKALPLGAVQVDTAERLHLEEELSKADVIQTLEPVEAQVAVNTDVSETEAITCIPVESRENTAPESLSAEPIEQRRAKDDQLHNTVEAKESTELRMDDVETDKADEKKLILSSIEPMQLGAMQVDLATSVWIEEELEKRKKDLPEPVEAGKEAVENTDAPESEVITDIPTYKTKITVPKILSAESDEEPMSRGKPLDALEDKEDQRLCMHDVETEKPEEKMHTLSSSEALNLDAVQMPVAERVQQKEELEKSKAEFIWTPESVKAGEVLAIDSVPENMGASYIPVESREITVPESLSAEPVKESTGRCELPHTNTESIETEEPEEQKHSLSHYEALQLDVVQMEAAAGVHQEKEHVLSPNQSFQHGTVPVATAERVWLKEELDKSKATEQEPHELAVKSDIAENKAIAYILVKSTDITGTKSLNEEPFEESSPDITGPERPNSEPVEEHSCKGEQPYDITEDEEGWFCAK